MELTAYNVIPVSYRVDNSFVLSTLHAHCELVFFSLRHCTFCNALIVIAASVACEASYVFPTSSGAFLNICFVSRFLIDLNDLFFPSVYFEHSCRTILPLGPRFRTLTNLNVLVKNHCNNSPFCAILLLSTYHCLLSGAQVAGLFAVPVTYTSV